MSKNTTKHLKEVVQILEQEWGKELTRLIQVNKDLNTGVEIGSLRNEKMDDLWIKKNLVQKLVEAVEFGESDDTQNV